jgi:SAM-dependent MidA family methyltransferase
MLPLVTFRPWRAAMQEALYGRDGFYVRDVPAAHFRTSVTSGPLYATAVRRLAGLVDDALGHPDPFDVVDVGTGGGELIAGLPDVPDRWQLTGIEVGDPWPTDIDGLLFANEWLDNVPLDIAVSGPDGPRLLQVDGAGNERPGPPLSPRDRDWLDKWGPAPANRADRNNRVEIGRTRDGAWSLAVSRLTRGAALAIDYAGDGTGSLTGFQLGREVPPVPDGTCDLTAHVVFASVAAAGAAAAGTEPSLLTQREALMALGVDIRRPPETLAAEDPRAYVAALAALSRQAALVDPAGLGGFRWLVQPVGTDNPFDNPLG